jgi:hypothetical protein
MSVIQLIANGDLRLSANQTCWAAQQEMEKELTAAVSAAGLELKRVHAYKEDRKHGFIGSQKEGMTVFAEVDPDLPIIVGRGGLAVFPPYFAWSCFPQSADSHSGKLVGNLARSGGDVEPEWFADQSRGSIQHAVE